MQWSLGLSGPFRLTDPGGAQVRLASLRLQALVAALALAGGRPVDRAWLWTLLWEDRAEPQARNSLRQAFTALRKACAGQHPFPFRVDARSAAIDPALINVDVQHPVGAYPRATEEATPARYRELLAGLNLPGAEAQAWLTMERQRWRDAWVKATTAAMRAGEQDKATDAALRCAEALLDADPLNEIAFRGKMRGLLASGDRVGALRAFHVCRDVLRCELGVEPSPETEALYRDISAASTGMSDPNQPLPPAAVPAAEKPSIVVLPFSSHGAAGSTPDYFADSLTETLTDDLSRFHDLHVVASRSAFAYRDGAPDIGEICRKLGVRYALSGSVRREADNLRIQARLVDGADGRVVWTERYDRAGNALPQVRDELSEVIVATLATTYGGRLRKAWQKSAGNAPTLGSEAYDCFTRGIDMVDQWTAEAVAPGVALLQRAVDLDPGFAKAHAKLSFCHVIEAHEGWAEDFDAAIASGLGKALEAIEADSGEPWGHWALSYCRLFEGRHDLSLDAIGHALRLNPNDADILADFGLFKGFAGDAENGIGDLRRAMRLNPHYPEWYALQLVQVEFDARRYTDAIATHARLRIGSPLTDLYLVASLAGQGDIAAATRALRKAQADAPGAVARIRSDPRRLPYLREADLAHFLSNLDLADAD